MLFCQYTLIIFFYYFCVENIKKCDNINDYLKEFPDTAVLLITHYTRILEFIKPGFVHMMKDGKINISGDYELAKKIEKYGYNETFDLGEENGEE